MICRAEALCLLRYSLKYELSYPQSLKVSVERLQEEVDYMLWYRWAVRCVVLRPGGEIILSKLLYEGGDLKRRCNKKE